MSLSPERSPSTRAGAAGAGGPRVGASRPDPGSAAARRRQLAAVVAKEALEAIRDRRAMLAALVYPLLGPVLVALVFAGVERGVARGAEAPVGVVAGDNAPALVAALVADGVTVRAVDLGAPSTSALPDVIVSFADDVGASFAAGRPALVLIEADFSRPASGRVARRVAEALARYGQRVALSRALAHGLHPEVMAPLRVQTRDLATPAQHAASLLHMVPMFVLLAIFVGAMQVAIDATAGERERGSLEPLLLHPVSTETIAAGKFVVATALSALAGALTLALTVASLPYLPSEALGIHVTVAPKTALRLAALLLPMAPMAAGVLLLAASFARSFKEAQTWLSVLLFVPMLPGLLGSAWQLDEAPWMWAVPALGQHVLTVAALRGDEVHGLSVVVACASSLVVAALGVALTARNLRHERMLFVGQ
jgi:sodium transport system permease protein